MELKNSTDWPDYFIRRALSWCAKQVGLPIRSLREAAFRKKSHGYSGHCWWYQRRIVVSVKPGDVASLVRVTAHELAHLMLHDSGSRTRKSRRYGIVSSGGSEKQTMRYEHHAVKAFEADAEKLVAEWSEVPAVRSAARSSSIIEKRAAKIDRKVAEWKRKARLAETKVKFYLRKQRYYKRITGETP